MVVISTLTKGFYIKGRPKAYSSDGMTIGGNKGFVLAALPRDYPTTSQQRKVRDVAKTCGIHSGIGRAELRKKMVECVGPKMGGYAAPT